MRAHSPLFADSFASFRETTTPFRRRRPRRTAPPRLPPWRRHQAALACGELGPCQLLRRCLENSGDHEAWWAFVQRNGTGLRRFLWAELDRYRLATCSDDLDDWEQEVYCRLLGFRRKTAFRSSLAMWRFLHEVVASVVVDGWRHRHRLKRRPLSAAEWRYLGCRKKRADRRPRRRPRPRARRKRSRKSR